MKKILYPLFFSIIALASTGCNNFLDTIPDSRTELDTDEKISKIVTSAYAESTFAVLTEVSSDNVDDYGAGNPYTSIFREEVAYWEEVTEINNDDPKFLWEACYDAAANANLALQAIAQRGNPESLNAERGEALLCRAYAHFVLVNVFCQHYNPNSSMFDMGVHYMEELESELLPHYPRGTVLETYEKIERDLLEGLPLIDDGSYRILKYHFNSNAANAFAARFYLYKGEWEKVIEYANKVLGTQNPSAMLRNWSGYLNLEARDWDIYGYEYINALEPANLLLITSISYVGYPAYREGSLARIAHGTRLANQETYFAETPYGLITDERYYVPPFPYVANNHDIVLVAKNPYLMEYTDLVTQSGYIRSVTVDFCTDELILARAEAYIMTRQYDRAMEDMNAWFASVYQRPRAVSAGDAIAFFLAMDYYDPSTEEGITIKHQLNPPGFSIDYIEQENLLHLVLHLRRIQTLNEGLRWFDLKRYGIDVYRRTIQDNKVVSYQVLPNGHANRAIQLPLTVITAGVEPNPRAPIDAPVLVN